MVRFENDEMLDVTVVVASLDVASWRGHIRAMDTESEQVCYDCTGDFAYREILDSEDLGIVIVHPLIVQVDRGETTPGEYHN